MRGLRQLNLGRVFGIVAAATLILAVCPCGESEGKDRNSGLDVRSISTRPDMVSGGEALVQITVPTNLSPNGITVALNGGDVTGEFHPGQDPGSLLGLVNDLHVGKNILGVTAPGGRFASLELINHPITGPIFSGPHQEPFICETQTYTLPDGTTLGPPLDASCSAVTRVVYVYKSTSGAFNVLPNPTLHPTDLARTTTNEGRTVNYIVRVEIGTINRAIYQTAILHDPGAEPPPTPFMRPEGWNGKLIYTFGGGLNPGYHQGVINIPSITTTNLGPLNDSWLSLGYAYAQSTLNVNASSDNTVVSAETALMVKEHFIDEFGPVRFTIGTGISGGSMHSHEIAQDYPGIFDGVIPSGFADNITTIHNNTDCSLLNLAINSATVPFTHDQMTAVSGYGDWQGCQEWMNLSAFAGLPAPYPLSPGELIASDTPGKTLCSPVIPAAVIYDPVTNPGGARCTYQDNSVNIFGRDPGTSFARRPFDNVGVQYGLGAFNAGKISAEQFVQLNQLAGGYDIDGNFIASRYAADPEALRIAYISGRMNTGSGGLATMPIIDEAWASPPIDFRNGRISMFSVRDRLIAANGNADNQVIVVAASILAGGSIFIEQMDRWLENIANDPSDDSASAKVARNKPADVTDGCYGADGTFIPERAALDDPNSACNQLYAVYRTPRIESGAPIADDILKCQLKPLDVRDYAQPLTSGQLARLKAVFPQGVCDYDRPGVEEHLARTWLSYPLHKEDRDRDDD
jgi:hypothetical protein